VKSVNDQWSARVAHASTMGAATTPDPRLRVVQFARSQGRFGGEPGGFRAKIRPPRWYLAGEFITVKVVIRVRGAASIFMGRTPHEMHDELCRADAR
jgi:hypothetical protein